MEDLANDLWALKEDGEELSYHSIVEFMTEKLSEQERQIAELKDLLKEVKQLEKYTTGALLRKVYRKIKGLWKK
ncbi:MAG: hypothetical protein K2P21_08640 [Lachnospiraceae bacterium]|nr:hypothetical protein [Lachnospiraceae bacterium]